jgi:hypothetical protein
MTEKRGELHLKLALAGRENVVFEVIHVLYGPPAVGTYMIVSTGF